MINETGLLKMILTLIILPVLTVSATRNITDLTKCKLSHLGLDFIGEVFNTEGGIRCQSWTSKTPVNKIDSSISDAMFAERSKERAKNYCRNPLKRPEGPWCYTTDVELIDDVCDVPLCSFFDCKLTGPGMGYGGKHAKSVSDKKCLKWDKHRSKVTNTSGAVYEQEKFSKRRFPDETRGDASKYCRNPDGDLGGPWCFVNSPLGKTVEKQYCDIPFCDEENCVTYTKDSKFYSHYTMFNETLSNLTFGLKLWNPDDELVDNSARLLLSLFALPLNGEEIEKLQIGIEISISNHESAMTLGNKDKEDFEPTVAILKSSKFTYFSVSWSSGFVTLHIDGNTKPLFLSEYKGKTGLFAANKDKFFYYSILGKDILWSFPFCDEDDECEIHKTTSLNFERFWPLQKTNTSHDLKFDIRAFHSVNIKFQLSPTTDYPNVVLILGRKSDNISTIVLQEHNKAMKVDLISVTVLNLLNFWEWKQFLVTFFGDTIQVYWIRDVGTQLLMEVKHNVFSKIRWFSPASYDSLAEWTFFCSAFELSPPPKPWPPECVLNTDEVDYKGNQSVTHAGHPCVPWIHDTQTETNLGKKPTVKIWNFCRDPLNDRAGTFCYAVSQNPTRVISKESCHLRMCRSSECRMAGTGNDYIGKLNTTRSNRTCQFWNTNTPHSINSTYLNGTLYADQNVTLAENFCRDPSRNIAGPWCYTTDKNIKWDLCNVRDCDHTEECIIMTRGNGKGRFIYILPEWKEAGLGGGLHFALKEWNPDKLDGILFEIFPLDDKPGYIRLIIGDDNNEKVVVYYSDKSRDDAVLVKEKSMPHLIPAGKWGAFWLQMRRGEIYLGYEGNSEPLFTWEHENKDQCFEPGYMSYMSIQNNIIGVHFKCTECHTERTSTDFITRIMPIGLWSTTENVIYNNLSIYARGSGIMLIPLLLLPQSGNYYAIAIGDEGTYIIFLQNTKDTTSTLQLTNLKEPVLKIDVWTHYLVMFNERTIEIFKDNQSVLVYNTTKTFLFYWFAVTTEKGYVEWTVNCYPADIDGAPRAGGWSAWSKYKCSVSCGGGTGVRSRTCINPRPNIRGELCKGPHLNTGACNEFECGDISPETQEKIRQRLKTNHYSKEVSENDEVVIDNDAKMLELIRTQSPKSYYQWTLNGAFVKEKPGEIEFINDNIVIKNALKSRDTGIYACVLYRVEGQRVILRVATLAVVSQTNDLTTRATLDITLVCNSAVLGYIYSDLSQAWLHNNEIYIDYGITTLAAVITEKITNLSESHSGKWVCRVSQKDLGLTWIVNIIQINVKGPPSWITHLMEDQFTAPIFGNLPNQASVIAVFIVIVITVFLVVFGCLYLYLKFGTLPQRKYKKYSRLNTE